jgi:hypothetical protein
MPKPIGKRLHPSLALYVSFLAESEGVRSGRNDKEMISRGGAERAEKNALTGALRTTWFVVTP